MIQNVRRGSAFGTRYRESLPASGIIERVNNELKYRSVITDTASPALPSNQLHLIQKVHISSRNNSNCVMSKIRAESHSKSLTAQNFITQRDNNNCDTRKVKYFFVDENCIFCSRIISSPLSCLYHRRRDILYLQGISVRWGKLELLLVQPNNKKKFTASEEN